jgi:NADP-dependent 3-hydroxy acid dehydrogenase YdfG
MNAHARPTYNRVWFITEASTGLGRAVAEAVLARGEQAVVAARTPERIRDFIERYPAQALVLELNVGRREQIRRAVAQAGDRFGHIDVLVNSAADVSEALVQELAPFGITVTVGEPGEPDDPGTVAEAIIAAVDAETLPRR